MSVNEGLYKRYLIALFAILTLKSVACVYVILQSGIGLGPDEAQYWTWSRVLDFGYYSKPPGIAWQIWLGTKIFGETELGVRAFSLVFGILIPLTLFYACKNGKLSPLASFSAAAAFALSPIGVFSSLLAITDGGMIVCWTIVCLYLVRSLSNEKTPNYYSIGFLIGLGALFKWPVYLLWLLISFSFFFFPKMRSWKLLVGVFISLFGLLPSVYWNKTHEWATFRHVLSTVSGGHGAHKEGSLYHGNLFEFIGAQVALVSPILFVMLLMALFSLYKRRGDAKKAVLFCGGMTFLILGAAFIISLFMKLQGNWAIFAYPTAFIVLGWYVGELNTKLMAWLYGGLSLSIVLCAFVFILPALQAGIIQSPIAIPYKISPFRHNVGWNQLKEALKLAGYDPEFDYLISDKYQTVSLLSFYGPKQKMAYFLNLHGIRKNQFSYWKSLESEKIQAKGFFVVVESMPQLEMALTTIAKKYTEDLSLYFSKVEIKGLYPLFSANGLIVKGALVIECEGYTGRMPKESGLY